MIIFYDRKEPQHTFTYMHKKTFVSQHYQNTITTNNTYKTQLATNYKIFCAFVHSQH